MSPRDQEYINRYIYQVVRHLPKDQRNEVEMELEELISDMLEESGSMEEVLTKLGDPDAFAKRYQDDTHYLIGPEYFDHYIWFFKVIMICTAVIVLIVSVTAGIQGGAGFTGLTDANRMQTAIVSATRGITNGIVNLLISCVGVFGCVTLIFAVLERCKVRFGARKVWTPDDLTPMPNKKAMISRSDSIVNIVAISILGGLLFFAPWVFSAISKDGEAISVVPVFNLDQWSIILPVLLISCVAGLIDEIVRLVIGRYTKTVMISSIIFSSLQIILTVLLLKVLPFWNPNFAAELRAQTGETFGFAAWFDKWNGDFISNCLVAIFVIITLAEVGTTVYKTLKYGWENEGDRGML